MATDYSKFFTGESYDYATSSDLDTLTDISMDYMPDAYKGYEGLMRSSGDIEDLLSDDQFLEDLGASIGGLSSAETKLENIPTSKADMVEDIYEWLKAKDPNVSWENDAIGYDVPIIGEDIERFGQWVSEQATGLDALYDGVDGSLGDDVPIRVAAKEYWANMLGITVAELDSQYGNNWDVDDIWNSTWNSQAVQDDPNRKFEYLLRNIDLQDQTVGHGDFSDQFMSGAGSLFQDRDSIYNQWIGTVKDRANILQTKVSEFEGAKSATKTYGQDVADALRGQQYSRGASGLAGAGEWGTTTELMEDTTSEAFHGLSTAEDVAFGGIGSTMRGFKEEDLGAAESVWEASFGADSIYQTYHDDLLDYTTT